MTDLIPKIRVGVDWDGDWEIAWDDAASDPLNLFPDNATLRDDQAISVSDGTWYVVRAPNPFSEFAYHIKPARILSGIKLYAKQGAYKTPSTTLGSLTLPSAGTYTFSFYIRQPEGTGKQIEIRIQNATIFLFVQQPTLTNGWQRYDCTFSTLGGSFPQPIFIRFISMTDATEFEVSYRAAFVSGSTPLAKFNIGTLRLNDNITNYVTAWQSKLGRSNSDDVFPSEGTLTVTLDNFDRTFSPEYASSPLYGQFKLNRRIVVQVQRPSTEAWETIWSGFISKYIVSPGGTGDGQAKIEAQQGIFRLSKLVPSFGLLENKRFDEVLDLVLPYGWQSAAAPSGITDKHHIDKLALWTNLDTLRQAEQGIMTFPLLGDGWNGKTSISSVLKEMLEVERGLFWINREGLIRFYNRHHYKDTLAVDQTISVDSDANDASYSFGGKVSNNIIVTYYPKELRTDQAVWKTRQPIEVASKETKEVEIKFETVDGQTVTISEISPFRAPGTSVATVTIKPSGATVPASKYYIETLLENGSAKLKITNNYSRVALFTLVVHGTILESYGGQVVTSEPTPGTFAAAALEDNDKSVLNIDSKLIGDEDTAQQWGDYHLARYGLPRSLITSVDVKTRNTAWLERQLDVKVGSYLTVDEYQTATTQNLIVVGEGHDWRPGILSSKYVTDVAEYYPITTLSGNQTEFVVCY